MAIHNPPQYRYSLFEQWDRNTFALIRQIAKTSKYPLVNGSQEDRNQFLTILIRTQKSLHDWRDFPKDVIKQVQDNHQIDVISLNNKYPPESIAKDVPAWVTYEEDKIVSDFIDKLETRKIQFVGSDSETIEFVLRFILGQLGHDWEQTIMMIWEMLGDGNKLLLTELNKEMKNFDYERLFEK
ncbi:TPA: hypothetical protein HA241_03380 [Candidatus Woesearchaeota archaeon]|nr:hypothetical protein [Candidatus Woesearchaeota archaeon]